MPKPAPENRFRWGLWLRVSAWCVLAAGTGFAARGVRQFVFVDPRFALHDAILRDPTGTGVLIQGTHFAPHARVMQVFAPDFGRSVFRIPIAERRRRLLGIDWVEDATVARVWPNRLIVRLRERTPVAFVNLHPGFALVDEQGVLLALPPKARFALPVITGLTTEQTEKERQVRVQAMQELLKDLGTDANNVSEVHAEDPANLRAIVQMKDRAVELLMGDQNFRSRYQSFVRHYDEMRGKTEQPFIYDLRIDGRIVTK